MGKKLLIDATHAEETRVVVLDGTRVDEFDFETVHRRQLAGNIYLAKVTRVEPSLQAAFVDYGGNRHGFLAFAEIHPDYYQIPTADRQALLDEERALAEAQQADENDSDTGGTRSTRGSRNRRGGKRQTSESREAEAAQGEETAAQGMTDPAPREMQDNTAQAPAADDARDDEGAAGQATGSAPDTPAEGADADGADTTPRPPIAAPVEGKDPVATREIEGMEVVDLDSAAAPTEDAPDQDGPDQDASAQDGDTAPAPRRRRSRSGRGSKRGDQAAARSADVSPPPAADTTDAQAEDEPAPYRAADHATELDDQIESVADEDVSDEVRPARRPRSRRYKIQEVIKVRQIMLVQVVKEERGNKGAALTTYLSLAGRYCVLMPNTARGGGISRKITQAADRKKLKEIASEMEVPQGAGLIIRTAGANRTKAEIKRDYEYLSRLWDQIRDLTLQSVAPAPIYAEGDLIKRSIRDLYSREIDEVLVEGEAGYRAAKDFMKMIMPSHARNVKLYDEPLPLFARYQVESYLASMFNPTVQLKSGGYIVIGVTEALVAIDVNSGKATRQGSIEETALQTNLEAAEEIARQLRLRDLAGLIVIDFIDMEERRNNAAVEKKLKDKLKDDRARIQVGKISGFGLLEMSRQRLRPGMLEATTQPCPHCHGTGLIRSDNSLGLTILRALEEEGTRKRSREVLVRAPVGIVNYLINTKREHLAQIEQRYGMAIRVEADPALVSPDYTLEKFKTATRIVTAPAPAVVSFDAGTMQAVDDEDIVEGEPVADSESPSPDAATRPADTAPEGETGKPKRRRRRRRGGQRADAQDGTEQGATDQAEKVEQGGEQSGDISADAADGTAPVDAASPAAQPVTAETADTPTPSAETGVDSAPEAPTPAPAEKPARATRRRRAPAKASAPAAEPETKDKAPAPAEAAPGTEAEAETPKPAPRRRTRRKPAAEVTEAAPPATDGTPPAAESVAEAQPVAPQPMQEQPLQEQPVAEPAVPNGPADDPGTAPTLVTPDAEIEQPAAQAPEAETEAGTRAEEAGAEPQTADTATAEAPARPRRRGWWSLKG